MTMIRPGECNHRFTPFCYSTSNRDILFYVFLGVAAVGVGLFLTLGKEENEKDRLHQSLPEKASPDSFMNTPKPSFWSRAFWSVMNNALEVLKLWRDPRMLLMVRVQGRGKLLTSAFMKSKHIPSMSADSCLHIHWHSTGFRLGCFQR